MEFSGDRFAFGRTGSRIFVDAEKLCRKGIYSDRRFSEYTPSRPEMRLGIFSCFETNALVPMMPESEKYRVRYAKRLILLISKFLSRAFHRIVFSVAASRQAIGHGRSLCA